MRRRPALAILHAIMTLNRDASFTLFNVGIVISAVTSSTIFVMQNLSKFTSSIYLRNFSYIIYAKFLPLKIFCAPRRGLDAEEATRLVIEEQLPALVAAKERGEVTIV